MISQPVCDDEVLAYACRDLDPVRRAEVESALEMDGAKAAAARKMARTYDLLCSLSFDVASDFNHRVHARWTGGIDELSHRITDGLEPMATCEPRAAIHVPTIGRRSIAVAAGVCLAAAVTWLSLLAPQTTAAYGPNDLPVRLQQLQSLHVKGWIYHRTHTPEGFRTERRPRQWYVERPNRYWRITGSGAAQRSMWSDGQRRMSTDPERSQVVMGLDIRLSARMRVEYMLQNRIVTELTGALRGPYQMLRTEQIRGQQADVYQRTVMRDGKPAIRAVIWLNPTTGLPLKSRTFRTVEGDREVLHAEYDVIRPNAPAPPEALSFQPPDGHEIVQRDVRSDSVMMGDVAMDGRYAAVRFALNIHDQAILVCWGRSQQTDGMSVDLPILDGDWQDLTVKPAGLEGPWRYRHRLLRIDRGRPHDWLWSLTVPTDPGAVVSDYSYVFDFGFHDTAMTVILSAVQFEPDELSEVIYEAQTITHPTAAAPDQWITLDRIEQLIADGDVLDPPAPAASGIH